MYNVNDELKQKIRLHLSRKRCTKCFASYEKDCLIYVSGSDFFAEKTRFSLTGKPQGGPVSYSIRQPFASNLSTNTKTFIKSFSGSRISLASNKEREMNNVLFVEIYCSKCACASVIEISLDGFLTKKFSKASVVKEEFYEEETED
jgi:hypothetical protein